MHRINLSDHWTPAGPGRWVRRFGRPRTLDPGETAWLVGTAAGDGTLTANGQVVAELVAGQPFAADVTALLQPRNEAVIQGSAVGPVAMEMRRPVSRQVPAVSPDLRDEHPAMDFTETPSADQLDTFPNPRPGREYTIEIVCPEFTSVCPKTGQPDFGTLVFTYVPADKCVELKSLKLYLQRFRNQGIFYEQVTNRILDDFVAAAEPVRCTLVSKWTPRGGISTNVTCSYSASAE